ncbi:MAG: hypothetical protein ACOCZL_05595, partial [Bacteroidota bacterium]
NPTQTCCQDPHGGHQQCSGLCGKDQNKDDHSECCFDIKKKIETDSHYNYSQHSFRWEPLALVSVVPQEQNLESFQQMESLYSRSNAYVPPPKLHSSVVLLL